MANPKSKPCTFCRILQRELPAHVVYEDDHVLAFLDHRPLQRGHLLLVPRQHHETLGDLPEALLAPLFAAAQRLTRALEQALDAAGSFVAINNRISQSVPHLHVHLVPRWPRDGLFAKGALLWLRRPYPNDQAMAELAARIRAVL